MLTWIQHIDEQVLYFIHHSASNKYFDMVLPWCRNAYTWSPVYLFLLVFMYQRYGKKGLWWCAFFFVTFVFSDFISASIIKPIAHRSRPCNNDLLPFSIRHLVNCGSGYSFPSSHAANHFGMSTYIIFTMAKKYKWVVPLAMFWAMLVCYAQLYVGVHYPSDIIGGFLIGALIGWFFAMYFNKRFLQMGYI